MTAQAVFSLRSKLISTYRVPVLCIPVALFLVCSSAFTAPPVYVIQTFKNGQLLGSRPVTPKEFRSSAEALNDQFSQTPVDYRVHLQVVRGQSAKDRCYNLYASRQALAAVEAGLLDASATAEDFFKKSVASLEEVNSQTQVKCSMGITESSRRSDAANDRLTH